jgi:hypothetical protein
LKPGSQPIPAAWRPDPPLELHESLAHFIERKERDQSSVDLFEFPRSKTMWEIFWIDNELRCQGYFNKGPYGRSDRHDHAARIWEMGRKYCWFEHEMAWGKSCSTFSTLSDCL